MPQYFTYIYIYFYRLQIEIISKYKYIEILQIKDRNQSSTRVIKSLYFLCTKVGSQNFYLNCLVQYAT